MEQWESILATVLAIIGTWSEVIVDRKKGKNKEGNLIRILVTSLLLIAFVVGFFKEERAKEEKRMQLGKQDSMNRIIMKTKDGVIAAYRSSDSAHKMVIALYGLDTIISKTVDRIQTKSAKIDTTIDLVNQDVRNNSKASIQSFQKLTYEAQRVANPLDTPMVISYTMIAKNDTLAKAYQNYLKIKNPTNPSAVGNSNWPLDKNYPCFALLSDFLFKNNCNPVIDFHTKGKENILSLVPSWKHYSVTFNPFTKEFQITGNLSIKSAYRGRNVISILDLESMPVDIFFPLPINHTSSESIALTWVGYGWHMLPNILFLDNYNGEFTFSSVNLKEITFYMGSHRSKYQNVALTRSVFNINSFKIDNF